MQIRVSRVTPSSPDRFFFFCLITGLFALTSLFGEKPFPARGFAKILSKSEAADRLESYRSFVGRDLNRSAFHSAFAFRFRLRHMPRRGEEFFRTGTMYGMALGHGLSRVDLEPLNGQGQSLNFLLSNGPKPKAWIRFPDTLPRMMEEEELFKPLIEGMNQSPFDLLMPFVFWDAEYIKSGRVAGRPSHLYSFSSPLWVLNIRPDITKIVMALDKSYEAPLRIETFAQLNVPDRTFILNSFKKVSDHWIIKSLDCKERITRSNTRFEVTSAALRLDLDRVLFSPDGLLQQPLVPEDAFISTN